MNLTRAEYEAITALLASRVGLVWWWEGPDGWHLVIVPYGTRERRE